MTNLEQETFLHIVNDIDGCVVELNSLSAISLPVRHITLCPKDSSSLFKVKSVLKKHVDLTRYSN